MKKAKFIVGLLLMAWVCGCGYAIQTEGIEQTDLSQIHEGVTRSLIEEALGSAVLGEDLESGRLEVYQYDTGLSPREGKPFWGVKGLDPAATLGFIILWTAHQPFQAQELREEQRGHLAVLFGPKDEVKWVWKGGRVTSDQALVSAKDELERYRQEFPRLLELAQCGNFDAQQNVGIAYERGAFVAQDYVEALKWYSVSLRLEDPVSEQANSLLIKKMTPAQVAEGRRLASIWQPDVSQCRVSVAAPALQDMQEDAETQYGLFLDADDDEATLEHLCRAANGGYPKAQVQIGRYYQRGTDAILQDKVKALKWYTLAESRGSKEATSLKARLAQDLTLEQIAVAERLIARWHPNSTACEARPFETYSAELPCVAPLEQAMKLDADTQLQRVTDCSGRGFGLAVIWRWRCFAAHQGHNAAQNHVGHYYRVGSTLIQQDVVEAYIWYSLAAGNGNERAAELRHEVSGQMTPDQIAEAERLVTEWRPNPIECETRAVQRALKAEIEMRAQEGDTESMYEYAYQLNDLSKAWRWYCLAAHHGHAKARYAVGNYYRWGRGPISPDSVRAHLWYRLAGDTENAVRFKGQVLAEMTPDQIAEAERLVAEWQPNPAECEVISAQAEN